jgi:DNA-binding transcriptional regulator YiaG
MRMMGIDHSSLYAWEGRRSNPSSDALAKMALRGLDTYYILTGVRK